MTDKRIASWPGRRNGKTKDLWSTSPRSTGRESKPSSGRWGSNSFRLNGSMMNHHLIVSDFTTASNRLLFIRRYAVILTWFPFPGTRRPDPFRRISTQSRKSGFLSRLKLWMMLNRATEYLRFHWISVATMPVMMRLFSDFMALRFRYELSFFPALWASVSPDTHRPCSEGKG